MKGYALTCVDTKWLVSLARIVKGKFHQFITSKSKLGVPAKRMSIVNPVYEYNRPAVVF